MSKRSGRGRSKSQGGKPRGPVAQAERPTYTKPPPLPAARIGKAATRPKTAARTPAAIEAALHRSGMDSSASMAPGRPVSPYQGYSQPPRAMDYPIGVNIAIRTRASWGLPSFDTLRDITANYDVARICINHKISELQSMPPMFLPADGVRGDVDDAIAVAKLVLKKPDRKLRYMAWLSKLMENALKFDATPTYRRRNFNGQIIGLEVPDGTTIMPYVDEHGRRPEAPAPAYYQIVHGQIWNWYTEEDISYEIFRPQENTPFGCPPMETILLTANTDIRFQWHFLQLFTEGSVPAGFVEVPPDISSPDQVAEWQDYWDAMVAGDQSILHKLIAVPSGTKVTNSKPEAFDSAFPEYLMARVCAAYGVVPQDVGLVKDVNRSSGETQTDIQFRVNTLPWVMWIQDILTSYLQDDIGLPVKVELDTGREKEDRLADAQAWKIYVETGAASPDEMRSKLLGLPTDNLRPVGRFFNNTRLGPIPLLAIEGVSGKIDSETHGPADDQPPLDMPYVGPVGTIPQMGTTDAAQSLAATDTYQTQERQQLLTEQGAPPDTAANLPTATVAKASAAKAAETERARFDRYAATRLTRGRWRDFQFTGAVDPVTAHRLNDGGRAAVRKAIGSPVAAGLAVRARDTGRVLMLQRGLDGEDPASGMWEFPGGGIGDGESPLAAAVREWSEEVGILLAVGDPAGQWSSPDGVYRGFVVDVPSETGVPIFSNRDSVTNPDDPDGDAVEAVAWWDPSQLPDNPAVRTELAASMPLVIAALEAVPGLPDGLDVEPDVLLAKAGDSGRPKVPRSAKSWPGWERDLELAAHYAGLIRTGLADAIDTTDVAARWLHAGPVAKAAAKPSDPAWQAAKQWLVDNGYLSAATAALDNALTGAYTEAFALGDRSAVGVSTRAAVDWAGWTPGDPEAATLVLGDDGMGAGLQQLLADAQITISSLGQGRMDALARALALSLENGDSSDALARDLRDILDNPRWANLVATTEIARAVSVSSMQVYADQGIGFVSWATADDGRVCASCSDNEDMGIVPIGSVFPSGDTEPPGHPACRCAILAELDPSTNSDTIATGLAGEGE